MPDPTIYDEQEVLIGLRNGDKQAFTAIYEHYSRQLLAMAYNYTKEKSAAEEIVQEVFVGLWERRNKLLIQSLGPYLATAIKFSVFRTLHRDRKRKELLKQHYLPEEIGLDEAKINARFLQEYINGIVEQLPPQCQLVFKYSRERELSIPEIATEMGIAEKTVEAHLSKALKEVRRNLKDSGLLLLLSAAELANWIK